MIHSPRSFIDVLFILLLGTIVMLTQSVQLGELDADLLKLGSGAVSLVPADRVQIVVVDDDELRHDGRVCATAGALAAGLPSGAPVLLLAADRDLRHHRIVSVWADLSARGLDVNLGASPSGGDVSSDGRAREAR